MLVAAIIVASLESACMANYTLLQRINYLVNTGKDIWDCHSSCDASKDDQHPKISKGVPPKCEAKPRSLRSCRLRVIKPRRTTSSPAGRKQGLLMFKITGRGRSMNWNCENMPCGQTCLDSRQSSGADSGCKICGLFVSKYYPALRKLQQNFANSLDRNVG